MALTDRREVEFDDAALIAVVAASQRAAQSFGLPGMVPHAVHFYPKEGEVAFVYGTAQSPRAVRMQAVAVGALLVSYCIRSKIPMPRTAGKSVRIEEKSVILAFRVEFSQVPAAAAESSQTPSAAPVVSWAWVAPERVPR